MDELQMCNEEVKFQRALAVLNHRVQHGSTIRAACEACNVPPTTFYAWLNEGVLSDYLADSRESRATAAVAMAVESVPEIMTFLINVARGDIQRRGVNPIAAAQIVLGAAGIRDASPTEPARTATALTFTPQMVVFVTHDGAVSHDAQGQIEVIDGETKVLPGPDSEEPGPG